MSIVDYLVLAVVALMVALAVFKMARDKKRGVKCSGCSGCSECSECHGRSDKS
ncbi:FeoB-associated Cys-rich membrane protein [Desulfoscipio sp. XC116]|uniref:FeoB-associated Cys-rich membrane protein n=1 Tax=Desulfoscipio sp. XC116 TaxID=3144975 RepID=UPI00325B8B1F